MAVTGKLYGLYNKSLCKGEINWETDTIKVALCTSSYSFDQDTHDYFNDITNELPNGNGYTSGGGTIENCTLTYNSVTNTLTIDGDNTQWSNLTATMRYGIIYKDSGVSSTSPLVACIDFGEDIPSVASTFSIRWHSTGIIANVIL